MSRHKLAGRQTVRQAHADRQADWEAQAQAGKHTQTDKQTQTGRQTGRKTNRHRGQHRFTQFLQTTVSSIPPPPPPAVHQTLFTFYLHPPHKCSMLNISMNIYTFSIHLHLHDPPLYHMKDEEFDPIMFTQHYTTLQSMTVFIIIWGMWNFTPSSVYKDII